MRHGSLRGLCALAVCAALLTPALAAHTPGEPETQAQYDVTWEELDERIRFGGMNARTLTEQAANIQALDYEKLKEEIIDQINGVVEGAWVVSQKNLSIGGMEIENPYYDPYTGGTLQQAYGSLKDALDAIRDGDTQKDNADAVRQIEDGVEQIVGGGESLYLTILELEQTLADGQRGLAAIDRSLEELRLRSRLGQVSQQQVESLERTRASTASQLDTLRYNITLCKTQLQSLMGEELTGVLTLSPLPDALSDGWTAPDYDADLAAARQASFTLYRAKQTLDDARDAWNDSRGIGYQYKQEMAQHTWAAAQAAYAAAETQFDTAFKALYDALGDYEQVWEDKKQETAYRQTLLSAAQTRYQRGMISKNALITAQDDLAAAQSAQEAAWRNLFSARNSYRRAVEYGLV